VVEKCSQDEFKILKENLECADKAVRDHMLTRGVKKAADFEFQWDKSSDVYRALYDPNIRPFVDKTGRKITVANIISRRSTAKNNNLEEYNHTCELAVQEVQRKKAQLLEWDKYRLHKSMIVFPFIDSRGRYMSEEKIIDCRRKAESASVSMRVLSHHERKESIEKVRTSPFSAPPAVDIVSLDLLMIDKQQCEYELMVWNNMGRD